MGVSKDEDEVEVFDQVEIEQLLPDDGSHGISLRGEADGLVARSRMDLSTRPVSVNSSEDEEATLGWTKDTLDRAGSAVEMETLLSSGESSPTVPEKPLLGLDSDGSAKTTWQKETRLMLRTAFPLIFTFLLQISLTMTSIFSVGRLGKSPLAAATLASTTANITGFAIYQGLCTGLDTLCAQAFGSGRPHLVGLHLQRMVLFLWLVTIPMACVWYNATSILSLLVPDQEVARLAGQYLRILVLGAPGYAAFESGKRFVQGQGIFSATTYCLLFCAPLNILLHYLFVFRLRWGYLGAPVAASTTMCVLPLSLLGYVRFVRGMQCWGGFSRAAFRDWWPMISLAAPGLVVVLAEFMAFELLTLSASWLSTAHLAAQAILLTICATAFAVPWSFSIATSTRIAMLVGAGNAEAARTATKVCLVGAVVVPTVDMVGLILLRRQLPALITNEEDVLVLAVGAMPMMASIHIFDATATTCNGILRGIGRQVIGGYVNVFSYYVVGLPIAFGTAFLLHWDLHGLWFGIGIGLVCVTSILCWFIYHADWQRAIKEARGRNIEALSH